ncbi:diacylglycerol kinase family protein [bacterium]|nr:diacylglycerol kinase family protein [bacterium]
MFKIFNFHKKISNKVEKLPYPKTKGERKFHHVSFKYAFNGVKWAFKTQPNFQIHTYAFTLLGITILFFSFFSLIEYYEIVVLMLVSALVFAMEMVNTAIESLSDEVADEKYKERIRVAKDTSSGAVLISAAFAVLIGIIIFLPKLILLSTLFIFR